MSLLLTPAEATACVTTPGAPVPQAVADALPVYIDTATKVIEWLAGPVELVTRTRTVDGGDTAILLDATSVTAVTSVTVDGIELDASAYRVDLAAGIVYAASWPFTPGVLNVTVTYDVGGTATANQRLAAQELVRHLWQSGRQSGRPGQFNAPDDLVATPFGFAIPRRVVELCQVTTSAPGFA